jgi:hypothetical protein
MEIYEIIISAFITIFSVGLFVVSIASYKKYKNLKLLFVSLVFLIFLIKGILLSLALFEIEIFSLNSIFLIGIFDLIILILLFIATLKR